MLGRLDARGRLPQLEVALGDAAGALVLRHLDPLGAHDLGVLVEFAKCHDWHLYLQPAAPESVRALWPERPRALSYALPDFDRVLEFSPTDFIQVNTLMTCMMLIRGSR